jgi:hypothetical protein
MPENGFGVFAGWGVDDNKCFLSHVASEANFPFHVGFSNASEMVLTPRA